MNTAPTTPNDTATHPSTDVEILAQVVDRLLSVVADLADHSGRGHAKIELERLHDLLHQVPPPAPPAPVAPPREQLHVTAPGQAGMHVDADGKRVEVERPGAIDGTTHIDMTGGENRKGLPLPSAHREGR